MGDVLKSLGGVAGPIVGLATGNPLIGALVGAGSQVLGGATGAQGGIDPGATLMGGVMGGGAGLMGGNQDLMKHLGMVNDEGKLDWGKALATGAAAGGMMGAEQQRASAQKYTNSQIDLRNQLMSKILGPVGTQNPTLQAQPNPNAPYQPPKINPMVPSGLPPNLTQGT